MFEYFHGLTDPWHRLLAQFTTPRFCAFAAYGKVWACAPTAINTEDTGKHRGHRKSQNPCRIRVHADVIRAFKRFCLSPCPLCFPVSSVFPALVFYSPYGAVRLQIEFSLLFQGEGARAD